MGNHTQGGDLSPRQIHSFLVRFDAFARSLIIPLYVETALFGAFSLLIIIASYILIRWGVQTRTSKVMFGFVLIMYISSAAQWALRITLTWTELAVLLPARLGTNDRHPQTALDGMGRFIAIPYILSSINIILSDSIVLWRMCLIWSKKRVVVGLSVVAILLTLGFFVSFSVVEGLPVFKEQSKKHASVRVLGPVAFSISFVTNTWATGMTAFKAWQSRRAFRMKFTGADRGAAESILVLIVDSGIVYGALWLVYFMDTMFDHHVFGQFGAYLSVAMNQIIGMYPTLVVLLVAMQKSNIQRKIQYRCSDLQEKAANLLTSHATADQTLVGEPSPSGEATLYVDEGATVVGWHVEQKV